MIVANRLTDEQYQQNFADIHPPFETPEAALIEANRCLMQARNLNPQASVSSKLQEVRRLQLEQQRMNAPQVQVVTAPAPVTSQPVGPPPTTTPRA